MFEKQSRRKLQSWWDVFWTRARSDDQQSSLLANGWRGLGGTRPFALFLATYVSLAGVIRDEQGIGLDRGRTFRGNPASEAASALYCFHHDEFTAGAILLQRVSVAMPCLTGFFDYVEFGRMETRPLLDGAAVMMMRRIRKAMLLLCAPFQLAPPSTTPA